MKNKTQQKRYVIHISFVGDSSEKSLIKQPCATLVEAKEYESIIDDTVKEAFISDCVTGSVVHYLKRVEKK